MAKKYSEVYQETSMDLEKPSRVSEKRVLYMLDYLQNKGVKVEAWKRTDKPQWRIECNNWYWNCRSHIEAFNYLFPIFQAEKKGEYEEYVKRRNERYREELRSIKNATTKLL